MKLLLLCSILMLSLTTEARKGGKDFSPDRMDISL